MSSASRVRLMRWSIPKMRMPADKARSPMAMPTAPFQVLLKSYGDFAKLNPVAAEAKIIFYYGVRSIPRPWSLSEGANLRSQGAALVFLSASAPWLSNTSLRSE